MFAFVSLALLYYYMRLFDMYIYALVLNVLLLRTVICFEP
jgi:hypothetical protein